MTPSTTPAWQPDLTLKLREAPPHVKPRDHQIAAWDRMTGYYVNASEEQLRGRVCRDAPPDCSTRAHPDRDKEIDGAVPCS